MRLIWALIGLCCLIELTLLLADWGLVATVRLRALAYDYGGFWPGLLRDWQPNFALQPVVMFVSYGFLHAGLIHLGVNMMTLWSLSRGVYDRAGARGFAAIYGFSILGGAVGYALLASNLAPMVGASGGLFGLAGALLGFSYAERRSQNVGLWPIGRAVILLTLLNLVLWWAMRGQLAWQTHLGGFVAGWVVALLQHRATPLELDG